MKAFAVLALMCDESWAIGLADARKRRDAGTFPTFSLPFYFGQALSFYLMWVVFTFAGALVGPILGNIETYGADMALPTVFLVLLRGMWPGMRKALPWLLSLAAACGAYLLLPGAWYVPFGASAGLVLAWFMAGKA